MVIAGYHGTRLTDAEVASVRSGGLAPLSATGRSQRLIRALSNHPRWSEAAPRLNDVLHSYGPGNKAGQRENQVHLTLSRSGLVNDFNHYLTHGAEIDQHMAHALLGREGEELLRQDGIARLVRVAIPGRAALDAAHSIFTVDDVRRMGDVPNIVDEFLKAWSFRLAHPDSQSQTLQVDCGMIFRSVPVAAEWIVEIETLPI